MPFTQHPVREVSLLVFTGDVRRHQSHRPGLEYSVKQLKWKTKVFVMLYTAVTVFWSLHWFSFLYFQLTAVQNLEHNITMSQKPWDGWLDCVNGIESDGFTELQSEAVSCCGSFMHAEPRLCLIGAQVSLQWLPNKFN